MLETLVAFGLIYIILASICYFLPFIIAIFRNHRKLGLIFLANFLTGWCVIGWVLCGLYAILSNDTRKSWVRNNK
jgi:hypothetical protein